MAKPPLAVYALTWGPDGLDDVRPARPHEFPEIEAGKQIGAAEEIADYLRLTGKASATTVANALGRNRTNVSDLLNNSPTFIRLGKVGREVVFGLRASPEHHVLPLENESP